eukprot:1155422-Lingulodinium_polyedra.AAC.1
MAQCLMTESVFQVVVVAEEKVVSPERAQPAKRSAESWEREALLRERSSSRTARARAPFLNHEAS